MKSVSINGIARVNLGKSFAKKLRKEENVPCVIYGGKDNPIHFYAHENEFRKIIYTPEVFLLDLLIGDETIHAIMRDIQFHPVTDKILHIEGRYNKKYHAMFYQVLTRDFQSFHFYTLLPTYNNIFDPE